MWTIRYSIKYFIQGYIESIHRLPKAKIQDLFQSKNIYAVTVRIYSLDLLWKTLSVSCKSKKNIQKLMVQSIVFWESMKEVQS